jgi:uncharacterized protein (TIGR00730 family)
MAFLCVYCGSSPGFDPAHMHLARSVGEEIAREGHTLVYGGGRTGLMGAVADSVLAAGGKAVGVIPEHLATVELTHTGLTELHTVSSMHERKHLMASRADAFLALPGGIGTLEEIMEVFVWTQLGLHPKPCALFNLKGFYDPLVQMLQHMAQSGFLRPDTLSQLVLLDEVPGLCEKILSVKPVFNPKWLTENKP